jgi:hypothetical protein
MHWYWAVSNGVCGEGMGVLGVGGVAASGVASVRLDRGFPTSTKVEWVLDRHGML